MSLSIGASWGTWGVHLMGILIVKEGSGNGVSLSAGALLGEPGGGTPLLGIQKDMGRRAQGTDISLSGGPIEEPDVGVIYQGLMFGRRLYRWASVSIGTPLECMG